MPNLCLVWLFLAEEKKKKNLEYDDFICLLIKKNKVYYKIDFRG